MSDRLDARGPAAPAALRTLRILELLADAESALSLTEIASRLGLPKSSVHHVVSVLVDRGWVERDDELRMSLGLRAWEVGQAYDLAQSLTQRARPYLTEVRDAVDETVRLAVLSGTDQVCLAKVPGSHPLVFDQRIGARLPCHATGLGKALLSGRSGDEIRKLYASGPLEQFTAQTLADRDALEAELATIRERGYAEDLGEYVLGIRCVAVPVRTREGDVVASISVSGPVHRFDDEHVERARAALQSAAEQLGVRLGEATAVS
ncbi:IclR family transcriptional regulator [Agromyces sp. H66]|uniref:IclR family transcriptional regulator n=1 Tax=Agromyces sp. H66 TaxID=2529859 RepID=UPI00145AEF2B|nr:IclR family transcriptional regulator [Agromyces sp. H66]